MRTAISPVRGDGGPAAEKYDHGFQLIDTENCAVKKVVFADLGGMIPFESDPFAGIAEASYFYDLPSEENFLARCEGAEAICWSWINLTHEMLDAMSSVKMICYLGIGPQAQVDMNYLWSKGIIICNTPHYGDEAVAEHAMALMLSLARQVVKADKSVREGKWERFGGVPIRGATMGVLGLGGLGSTLAAMGNALGMNVICTTRNPSEERAKAHNVAFVSLDDLMSRSDFIQLAPVLNDDTTGIIGEKELGLMKEGAYMVNVSRGQVVQQDALINALESGQLAGFATDVFAEEPATDDPLSNFDNVILTPHIAYDTPAAIINMANIAANTIKAYLDGSPINVLEPD